MKLSHRSKTPAFLNIVEFSDTSSQVSEIMSIGPISIVSKLNTANTSRCHTSMMTSNATTSTSKNLQRTNNIEKKSCKASNRNKIQEALKFSQISNVSLEFVDKDITTQDSNRFQECRPDTKRVVITSRNLRDL